MEMVTCDLNVETTVKVTTELTEIFSTPLFQTQGTHLWDATLRRGSCHQRFIVIFLGNYLKKRKVEVS